MVVIAEEGCVNHGGTTSWNGQASHCRRCCASPMTEADGRPLQRRRLSEYPQRRSYVTGISLVSYSFLSCNYLCSVGDATPVDMHPEKRMRAAYTAFEERNLPILKQENPNLRLSQLKQILKKDWARSPENPLNQRLTQTK